MIDFALHLPRMMLSVSFNLAQYFLTFISSNSVVTPLFEKMLSASDAGRIGRLVLPKKCAEVSSKALLVFFISYSVT